MNLWGCYGEQLEVPASDSTFREFCFSGLMCLCVRVCGGGKEKTGQRMGGNTELQSSCRGWFKRVSSTMSPFLPITHWSANPELFPWFATVAVKFRATCRFPSWVFGVTTPDAPELKHCCAKSIFTSRGMISKNKPHPTCYSLLGSLDAIKSQPTD